MDALLKTNQAKSEKVAGSLPITCQICLGKVRLPVICPNQHVFCSGCMEAWLQRIQQCPTCRVPINQPPKPIVGGAPIHEAGDSFSNKDLRKTRVELLFKEYEAEILRLEQKASTYSAENEALHMRLKQNLQGTASIASTAADNAVLKGLTEKLERMTAQYNNAMQEVEKVKKEKTLVEDKNVELHRETSRLRLELSSRSPRRFGRSTVSALESRVETYQKQIKQLEKALERSDAHIEYLESLLKEAKMSKNKDAQSSEISAKKNDKTESKLLEELHRKSEGSMKTNDYKTKPFEELPSTLSEISEIADEPRTKVDTTFDLEMPSPMNNARIRDPDDTMDDSTLNVSAIENAKKRLRFGDKDDMFEKPAYSKDNLNISMTPELENCMRILDEAERKVAQTTDDKGDGKEFKLGADVPVSKAPPVSLNPSLLSRAELNSQTSSYTTYTSTGLTNPAQYGTIPKVNPPPFSGIPSENGDLNLRPKSQDSGLMLTHSSKDFVQPHARGTSREQNLNTQSKSRDLGSMFSNQELTRSHVMGTNVGRDLNSQLQSQDNLMFTSRSSQELPRPPSQDIRATYGRSLSQDTYNEPHFSQDLNPRPSSRNQMFPQSLSQDSFPIHPPASGLESNSRGYIPSPRNSATTTAVKSTPLGSFSMSNAPPSTANYTSSLGREFESRLSSLSQAPSVLSDRGSAASLSGSSLSQPTLSSFPSQGGMNGNAAAGMSNGVTNFTNTVRNTDQLNF